MSVFHRIRDIRVLRSAAFVRLAMRLAAYNGAVAARIAAERRERAPQPKGRSVTRGARYERGSAMANNARAAEAAPPASAAALASLNAQLGGGWFSHRTVKAGDTGPAGGDESG